MLTVTTVLLVGAFGTAVANAVGKCPLWVSVILLCVIEALQVWPR